MCLCCTVCVCVALCVFVLHCVCLCCTVCVCVALCVFVLHSVCVALCVFVLHCVERRRGGVDGNCAVQCFWLLGFVSGPGVTYGLSCSLAGFGWRQFE